MRVKRSSQAIGFICRGAGLMRKLPGIIRPGVDAVRRPGVCTPGMSKLFLGPCLNRPVKYLLCWTPKGKIVGGTAQGMRVACAYGIPILNLAFQRDIDFIEKILDISVKIMMKKESSECQNMMIL